MNITIDLPDRLAGFLARQEALFLASLPADARRPQRSLAELVEGFAYAEAGKAEKYIEAMTANTGPFQTGDQE